jgi:bacterioferritin
MKGRPEVVAALVEVMRAELTASNQYLLGGAIARNAGFLKLATKLEAESKGEFEHARQVAERLLYLGAAPDGRLLADPVQKDSPVAQLEADLALEVAHAQRLNAGIEASRKAGDHGSATLLESILVATEGHVDWLETQLELAKKIGEGLYLSQQM